MKKANAKKRAEKERTEPKRRERHYLTALAAQIEWRPYDEALPLVEVGK